MWKRLLGGPQAMLLRSLRGTEWQQFVDYVSPSFFEVVPLGTLISQGHEIAGNALDGARFDRLRDDMSAAFAERGIDVRVVAAEDAEHATEVAALPEADRRAVGQRALEVYFAQLFAGSQAILDLRGARFAQEGSEDVMWFPRPFYVRWDESFLEGIQELYQGFYRGDDARFRRGLARLDLDAAEDVFSHHFGDGEQRSVRFDSRVFHSTFHEAFVRCRDAGVSLHGNFLALGLYLACLYDLLEALDLPFDVRAAFEEVAPAP